MPEDRVEQLQRLSREVHHVRVPWPVEARREQQPRVVIEEHEPGLMDRGDRQLVIAGSIPRAVLQHPQRLAQLLALAGLNAEEQAELARGPCADARPGDSRRSSGHLALLWIDPPIFSSVGAPLKGG